MPLYLIRFCYTPETWAKFVEAPEDRTRAVVSAVQSVGGRLHGMWYAFGEFDGFVLVEAPDNVSAASLQAAGTATGGFARTEATVLLSSEEMMEALARASEVQFAPPGAS
jgi:uncharacterized protein with GYD domain